ncbi:hypothetical protein ACIQGZ_07165 [Streptomyces sp. NPDC092296]|uniref:hypothetical protein n=1 Tax=Streptomyces sp. NPDC092296 TaxID=3366012 RepID=UPI0037FFE7A6
MPETAMQEHYACAARRHYDDAVYLLADSRVPNADYHLGFTVECVLKSLLLRYVGATVDPTKPGRLPPKKPWVQNSDGKTQYFSHLPELWSDVALLLTGRSGGRLASALQSSTPFENWSVDHRYRDGADIVEADVYHHRAAAELLLHLHDQALVDGALT